MFDTLLQTEIVQVVGAGFDAQESSELFVLLDEGILEVSSKDMMAVLDLVESGVELSVHASGDALAKELGYFFGG